MVKFILISVCGAFTLFCCSKAVLNYLLCKCQMQAMVIINARKMSVDFWEYISWFNCIILAENQSLKLKLLQSSFSIWFIVNAWQIVWPRCILRVSVFYFLAVLLISKYILLICVLCNSILPLLPVSYVIWSYLDFRQYFRDIHVLIRNINPFLSSIMIGL